MHVERHTTSLAFLAWIDQLWLRRRKAAHRRYLAGRRRVVHMGLWLCIHGGEGNSHPSSGHPYSGPLQMTSYWAGYPIYDWATVPVSVVYADAEAQLQIHLRRGDVYPWLAQQWPNTSPPCRRYAG